MKIFSMRKQALKNRSTPLPTLQKKKSFGVQRNVIFLFNLLKIMIQTTQDPLEIG
jgi:hypothetical protein